MNDIRRKSGLDYLTRPSGGDAPSEGSGGMNITAPRTGGNVSDEEMQKALFTTGRKILVALRDSPGRKAKLNQLVDATNIEKDELAPVVDKLTELNWAQYVVRDKYGNHTVEITPEGLATV